MMEGRFKRMDNGRNHLRQSSLPEGKPAHFFKIILPTTIYDKKLRLPMKFVQDYGDDLSAIVTLSDPNLKKWQMGLEKIDGDVWLGEGWERFVEYYSITSEFFLVFRYEGSSKFHVLIFDMTGSEIQYPSDYPNCNLECEELEEGSLESSVKKHHDYHYNDDYHYTDEDESGDSEEDNETEDEGFVAYHSSLPSESPSAIDPRGRGFTKFTDKRPKREYSSPAKCTFIRKRKRHACNVNDTDQSDSKSEDTKEALDHRRSKYSERYRGHAGRSKSRRKRKRRAFSVDDTDQSDSQSIEDIMEASNHRRCKPGEIYRDINAGRSKIRKKRKRRVFSVDDNDRSDSKSTEDIGEASNCRRCKHGEVYRGNADRYGVRVKKEEHLEWIRRTTCKSKNYRKRYISAKERDKAMLAARQFKSEFPSFRAVLRPHNLYNSFVYVPAQFASKYLDGRSEIIRLETLDGRKQWLARCFFRKGSGCGKSIGKGWARFAMDNDLQEGDVCVFELIKRKEIVLRVIVFRINEH